jgi:hypothetical protein
MKNHPTIGAATILILIGLFFLLNNAGLLDDLDLNAEKLWPGFVLLGGLAFLLQFFMGGDRDPGLIFVGTAATLLGLYFFLFTFNVELPFEFENLSGPIDWDDSGALWPAYPLIGGIAFVVMSLFSRKRDEFGLGIVAMIVGVVAFFYTLGGEELKDLVQFWPVLVILWGVGLLLQRLFRGGQR